MSLKRKLLVLSLILVALGLLYPGITQPVLTLTGTIEKSSIAEMGIELVAGEGADSQTRGMLTAVSSFLGLDQIEGQIEAYRNTRSIWGTVEELSRTGNRPVALLIVVFSMIIPAFKLLLQASSLLIPSAPVRARVLWLNAALSKWSMADVFVMGLLVAYMAGSASGQMGDMLVMDAQLEPGFYFFLAYCLFSVAAGIFMREPATVSVSG